ncbi:hypothetical protein BJX63DRAFT_427665 [Aspergillus granulosus]|uniref:FAD/NAD(P)-binding domain-containing protein n=1 Tax=Aspergillus granulosus TaxID=176169 RepID=A0ABR4I1N8_9EURO
MNIVIIGASATGLTASHILLQTLPEAKVCLINPSESFYWVVAAPRIVSRPRAFQPEQYLLPIKDAFAQYPRDHFEFITGSATAIDTFHKTVSVIANGSDGDTSIPYDYLLIASGSTDPSRMDHHRGAGPIGVELAGELAEAASQDDYRGVSIVLVSATERIFPILKPSASSAAASQLESMKVKIVTGTRMMDVPRPSCDESSSECWTVSLSNGETMSADVNIPTTGVCLFYRGVRPYLASLEFIFSHTACWRNSMCP